MKFIRYDIHQYDFAGIIKDWFNTECLSKLHVGNNYQVFSRQQDQSTHWHKQYYTNFRKDPRFSELYRDFLEYVIKPQYGEVIICQKIPTFRIHLPNNIAVGEWHRDREYRDKEWAAQVKELNYYLPFTQTNPQNTIWAERKENQMDYQPILASYGECVEWDASNLKHGNKANSSDSTRVSVDFRVIPQSRYVDSNQTTINTSMTFSLGGYYMKI